MADALRVQPALTMGLATGKTFLPLYEALVRLSRESGLSFAKASSSNLNEYVGLAANHPALFRRYMEENLARI